MEDIVGPAVEGLKETLGASLEKLWKQRLQELERREQALEERERQLRDFEKELVEREQKLAKREEAASSISKPADASQWPNMTLPSENEMSRGASLVPPTPDFGVNLPAAALQQVEAARPANAEQKEPLQRDASKQSNSSLFPTKKLSTGLFAAEESIPHRTATSDTASALFPSSENSASKAAAGKAESDAGSTLFPSPANSASNAVSSTSLFPSKPVPAASSALSNSAHSGNRSLFPAPSNQLLSKNQTGAGNNSRSLFPAANVQAPREEGSGNVVSNSPPAANVQTPPVAQSSPSAAVDTSDSKSASELRNVFEQKAQNLKKSTGDSRRRSWTPRHHELDLPDGQSKAMFKAHDAPYQARTSFAAPMREKRSLSDLLDEDKRRTESF